MFDYLNSNTTCKINILMLNRPINDIWRHILDDIKIFQRWNITNRENEHVEYVDYVLGQILSRELESFMITLYMIKCKVSVNIKVTKYLVCLIFQINFHTSILENSAAKALCSIYMEESGIFPKTLIYFI